jgi:hypothetical protein
VHRDTPTRRSLILSVVHFNLVNIPRGWQEYHHGTGYKPSAIAAWFKYARRRRRRLLLSSFSTLSGGSDESAEEFKSVPSLGAFMVRMDVRTPSLGAFMVSMDVRPQYQDVWFATAREFEQVRCGRLVYDSNSVRTNRLLPNARKRVTS